MALQMDAGSATAGRLSGYDKNRETGDVRMPDILRDKEKKNSVKKVIAVAAAGLVLAGAGLFGFNAINQAQKPSVVDPGPDGGDIGNPGGYDPETNSIAPVEPEKSYGNLPLDVSLDDCSKEERIAMIEYLEDVMGWDSANSFKDPADPGNTIHIQCKSGLNDKGGSKHTADLIYADGADGHRTMILRFVDAEGLHAEIGNNPLYKELEQSGPANGSRWVYKDVVTVADIPSVAELQPKS